MIKIRNFSINFAKCQASVSGNHCATHIIPICVCMYLCVFVGEYLGRYLSMVCYNLIVGPKNFKRHRCYLEDGLKNVCTIPHCTIPHGHTVH